jgi:hypothetical protein
VERDSPPVGTKIIILRFDVPLRLCRYRARTSACGAFTNGGARYATLPMMADGPPSRLMRTPAPTSVLLPFNELLRILTLLLLRISTLTLSTAAASAKATSPPAPATALAPPRSSAFF